MVIENDLMLKMEIVLKDDDLDKNEIDDMYYIIDKLFEEKNIVPSEQGIYIGYDNEVDEISGDLFSFLVIAGVLSEIDWFRKKIYKWNWYEDGEVENLIDTFEIRK